MIALRGRMSPEELALVPTVEAMVKDQRRKDLRDNEDTLRNTRGNTQRNTFKHYGGMMTATELHRASYTANNYGKDDDDYKYYW